MPGSIKQRIEITSTLVADGNNAAGGYFVTALLQQKNCLSDLQITPFSLGSITLNDYSDGTLEFNDPGDNKLNTDDCGIRTFSVLDRDTQVDPGCVTVAVSTEPKSNPTDPDKLIITAKPRAKLTIDTGVTYNFQILAI